MEQCKESTGYSNEGLYTGQKQKNFFALDSVRQSKLTRIFYVGIIFLTISLCTIFITPHIIGPFQRVLCHKWNYYFCEILIGYDAVYRIGFALAIWFVILACATLGVTSSKEKRAKIQNRAWAVKLIGLVILEVLFVLIPHSDYNGEVWMFFGLNGAFCYIILQYTFILDAANSFNAFSQVILRNDRKEFSDIAVSWFNNAKIFTTTFLYAVSLLSSITFYFMYASHYECFDNLVFLIFHLIMCFAASVIAAVPIVREISPQTGLFQCSVTSLYCTYLIWLAFSSEPDTLCNPSDFHRYPASPIVNVQVWVTLFITFGTLIFISVRELVAPQFGKVDKQGNASDVLELQTNQNKVTEYRLHDTNYGHFVSDSRGKNEQNKSLLPEPIQKQKENEKDNYNGNPFARPVQTSENTFENVLEGTVNNSTEDISEEKARGKTAFVWDDESHGVEYNYAFFHLTFCLATIFLMMSITNWYRLDEGEHFTVRLIQSWSAVWLRISASIFCSFIFIWSMIVPLVFPDSYRDLLFFQYMTSLPKYTE